uniref:Glycoside hydrolase n=1 Tax=Mycena chlorophos TaxID=658473 RepID=A0ABQ0L7T7_MYCCL|nr:glycoside hydrolase [Mycena chlorophos]
MRSTSFFTHALRLLPFLAPAVLARNPAGLPEKIYGVNLGSWLVLESWMLPQGWLDMGGQSCSDCSTCIATEGAFAEAYPDTVDEIFAKHWETWFNQTDADALAENGINTVRIPLGYWIVEALVNRTNGEYFPKGGLAQLRRGLQELNKVGIVAILDHHALPGAQDAEQQFTGRCTATPEFYTPYNYQRALTWTAVMATLAHIDPAFANAVALEAVNEPIMDASQTPGLGDFELNFVRVVRGVEFLLGLGLPVSVSASLKASVVPAPNNGNYTAMLHGIADVEEIFTPEVREALIAAVPILLEMGYLGLPQPGARREPLITTFMDVNWQYGANVSNPAAAAIGPQVYDNHLYYVFGGVADANPDAYMESICNLNRIQADAALGDSPLFFGEWGLPTQFNATDEFLVMWADAQKLMYGQGAGWLFWNFKVEISELAANLSREWSYLEGVKLGYLTKDPAELHNPDVCVPYLAGASSSSSSVASTSTTSSTAVTSSAPATTTSVETTVTSASVATTHASASASASAPATTSRRVPK